MIGAIITGAVAYFGARKPKKKRPTKTLDLSAIMAGQVPAHGFVRGHKAGSMTRAIGGWLSRLTAVVGIAAMIAVGVFVYTEFTARWQEKGMPLVPIQALGLASGAAAGQSFSRDNPRPRQYQTTSQATTGQSITGESRLLEDYM